MAKASTIQAGNDGPRGASRGRGPLTGGQPLRLSRREIVAESQRRRLLEGMASVVAAKGYAETSVADVVAAAGVSRRTFYEQFTDKQACFLAALEAGAESLFDRIEAAVALLPRADWHMRAEIAIRAYLEGLASEPELTWVFTFEALGAGPAARARRAAVIHRWVEQWRVLGRMARRADPSLPEISDAQLLALVGGIEELVRDRLLEHGAESLGDLADPASEIAITVLDAGATAAKRRRR